MRKQEDAKFTANILWMFALAMLSWFHPEPGLAGLTILVTFAAWLIGGWTFENARKGKDTPEHTAYEVEQLLWRLHYRRIEAGDRARADAFAIAANELREAFDLDGKNYR